MKKFLGNFSPAYGTLTGEGEMGKAASKGMFGLLPRLLAKDAQSAEEEEKKQAAAAAAAGTRAMKKGGYVTAADGCAKKGKTKGRMI